MAGSIATGQATIGTTAASLVAARTLRRRVYVRNTHASNVLYLGASAAVTTANGHAVPAGTTVEIDTDAAVFAIASAITTTVTYLETFDA
jgi:hypothetical protein